MIKERIVIDGVTKTFRIGHDKNIGSLGRLVALFSGKEPRKEIKVVKGISLKAKEGEIIGMIGKNGAGKSTLLRILSGIYTQDGGAVKTDGNIIPIIGLGFGFLERLSMKDNIYLTGMMFGLERKEIKERFDDIVEFAELQDFVNTKIFQFSTGMRHRLAFAIAINCNPEILLLDEVFEVGDKDFRNKSSKKIKQLASTGTTVILVSHELWMIEKHCDRTIWIKDGRIKMDGPTGDVLRKYNSRKYGKKAGKKKAS